MTFEEWWEANWKMICGTYFFSSEKTVAEIAWNESFQELLAYIDRLEDKTAYDNESLEKLYGRPRVLRSEGATL